MIIGIFPDTLLPISVNFIFSNPQTRYFQTPTELASGKHRENYTDM